MAQELTVKSYQPRDEQAIVDLFKVVFGRSMSPAYWQWRFGNNPTGKILIDLAWSGDVLAGHYAVSPVVVSVDGREHLTALSMTTMTHPDYRGRGLFVTLSEGVYQRMTDEGLAMVWGFPNIYSHRGFVRDLAWVDIYEVPTFRRMLAEGKPMPEPSVQITELVTFDVRFDQLWDEVKDKARVWTKRDSRYLDWRYGQNPDNKYTTLGHMAEGWLLGYAIYKCYQNSIDLVDILYTNDAVGLDLIYGVAQRAKRENAIAINTWLNCALSLHRKLEKHGFCNSEPITYLGARVLRPELDASEVYSFRNWYLTMGDSDVY